MLTLVESNSPLFWFNTELHNAFALNKLKDKISLAHQELYNNALAEGVFVYGWFDSSTYKLL